MSHFSVAVFSHHPEDVEGLLAPYYEQTEDEAYLGFEEACESMEDIRAIYAQEKQENERFDAFLRRCIFHYIAFPTQEQMAKIIRVHFDKLDEALLAQAMQAFYWLRSIDSIEKKPSTSELVDWLRALELGGVDPARIAKDIPFAGVLLKKDKDITAMQRRMR